MYKLICCILFIVLIDISISSNNLFSQDIIVKRDNTELKVKVFEIQQDLIKYKPIDFLDGPFRSIQIRDISKIVYENGRIENFVILKDTNSKPNTIITAEKITTNSTNSTLTNGSINAFCRASLIFWRNEGLSDVFGNSPLLGAGIELNISEDFKLGIDMDFISKTVEGETLRYLHYGAFVKYAWYPFGSNRPNICPGFGIKGVSLKDTYDGFIDKADGIGFSAQIGVEIPLGSIIMLDLGWGSVYSKVKIDEENVNIGSEIIYAGLNFNLW